MDYSIKLKFLSSPAPPGSPPLLVSSLFPGQGHIGGPGSIGPGLVKSAVRVQLDTLKTAGAA